MRVAIKFLLIVSLVQVQCASLENIDEEFNMEVLNTSEATNEVTTDDYATTVSYESESSSTTGKIETLETEEACTCCPVLPAFINDDSYKIKQIKMFLENNLTLLEKEFTAKKEELQGAISNLKKQAEPIKEKLREVRKVNRDKETELNIEEMSEKSLMLRREFKKFIDKMTELSDSRLESKNEYKELKTACRVKKGDSDYDEDECSSELAGKLESIEKANADISSTVDKMKLKHEEIVELENQIKVAEDDLWKTIFENREKIKDDIERMDEIYGELNTLETNLRKYGEKYEMDQVILNRNAKHDLEELTPKKDRNWISWASWRKTMPRDALFGGYDLDTTAFYVIRRDKDDSFEYGKFAAKRGQAYITKGFSEYLVNEFDILIGSNFIWCKTVTLTEHEKEIYADIPICRASYSDSVIPGTLLPDGRCRAGFGLESHYFSERFEILKQHKC